jgi:DNA adenine methylase
MTYDDAEGVRELATRSKFDVELVAMKNTHHAKMTELLIGRDLNWSRQDSSSHRQFEFNFDA